MGLFLLATVLGHVANIVTNVSAARSAFQGTQRVNISPSPVYNSALTYYLSSLSLTALSLRSRLFHSPFDLFTHPIHSLLIRYSSPISSLTH